LWCVGGGSMEMTLAPVARLAGTLLLVVIVVQLLCFITFGAATTSIDEVLSDEGIGLNMLMGLVQVRGDATLIFSTAIY
jgi:hypothetical protein